MADFSDPHAKNRMKLHKCSSWASFNFPDGMTESEVLNRRERFRKISRRFKNPAMEQRSRLPFEEMFLFGSHPENDVLSISQCPGCSRRYKTQWLHNFHWEPSPAGDFMCTCSKTVVLPHRSSSKGDHHRHHHSVSSGADLHHLAHLHSRQSHRSISPSKHQSSKSSSLDKLDPKSSKQMKKPTIIPKPKQKLMAPPSVTTIPSTKSSLSSKSQPKTPAASYTLSIPSEDTGQNETVESLLQSNNKSYSNGSNYGNKPIHMIATAVQKASKVALEGEFEQMKFYSDSSYEKKSKSGHSHSHGHSSSHGHSGGHSHSHSHSHGHSHSRSHKSSSSDSEKHTSSSNESATAVSGDSGSSHKSHSSKTIISGPSLQNFKIPLKSKSHASASSGSSASSSHSSSSGQSTTSHSKHKSKLSSSSKSHSDSYHSSHKPSLTVISCGSTVSTHQSHYPGAPHHDIGQVTHSSGSQQRSSSQGVATSITYKSPVHLPVTAETAVKVEIMNDELSPPPPKKKKKKKSKDEPRKILPLKDRLFDPDVHCGVTSTDTGIPCTRSLTCKTHSVALRRAVPGRSQNFDQLLVEHKKARDAEKAAKVAENYPNDSSAVSTPSPIAVQVNSPGTPKTSAKNKSKTAYTVSIPSPASGSNTSSRSAPSPSPVTIYSSSNNDAQPKVQSLSSQGMQSSSVGLFIPKLDEIPDKSSSTSASRSSTTGSPSVTSKSSSKNGNGATNPPVVDTTKSLFDVDDLITFSSGSKASSFSKPSCSLSKPTNLASTATDPFGTSTMVNPIAGTKTQDYGYNVEVPMDVQTESTYMTSSLNKPVGMRIIGNENQGVIQDSYQAEPMEIQDPLSAALEMAASAAAMGSVIPDISHGFSAPVGLLANTDHSSSLMGLSSAAPHLFPASGSTVYSSPTSGYTTGFTMRNPVHTITSSVYTPTVTQSYGMSAASAYSSSYAAAASGFQPASFHAEPSDYQKEAAYQAGFQASNYSPTFTTYTSPSSSLYQSAQLPRYPFASVYPKAPTVFPTSSVYPSSTPYPAASSAVYPPAPLYQAATSSLFPTEPPLFSIIDDLFSENPLPPPPMPTSHPYQDITNPDLSSRNPSSFQQQPFPPVSRTPASTPGMPPSLAASMDMNTPIGRQWGSSSTGTHYSPFSGGTGSWVLVTQVGGDTEKPGAEGGTTVKDLNRSKSTVRKRKKLLLAKEKIKRSENDPGDYLTVLDGGENIERGFVFIQSRKKPVDDKDKDVSGKNSDDADSTDSPGKDKGSVKLKHKDMLKPKRPVISALVPFETKRVNDDEVSDQKKKTQKTGGKSKPKITTVPYVVVPDPSVAETVATKISEESGEAVKAIESSAKGLAILAKDSYKRKFPKDATEPEKVTKKQCFDKILSTLNADFNVDIYDGMKRFRTKDFCRLLKLNTSLNGEKKKRKLNVRRRKGVRINFRQSKDHSGIFNEIETFIDSVPALEIEP